MRHTIASHSSITDSTLTVETGSTAYGGAAFMLKQPNPTRPERPDWINLSRAQAEELMTTLDLFLSETAPEEEPVEVKSGTMFVVDPVTGGVRVTNDYVLPDEETVAESPTPGSWSTGTLKPCFCDLCNGASSVVYR